MSENLLVHLQSVLGICAIIALAWAFSEDRRAFRWRIVVTALLLQAAIALVLLKFPPARALLLGLNNVVNVLATATTAGAGFVFGYVGGAGREEGWGIAVNKSSTNSEVWIVGDTDDGTGFPVLTGPDLTFNGNGQLAWPRGDAFVTKISNDLTLGGGLRSVTVTAPTGSL